jgi:hypothetical protein
MHDWSDESFDWKGLNEAIYFIGDNLVRYGRVNVRDAKEKYGTARIACNFGFYSLCSITHPRYVWVPYKRDGLLWTINYSSWFTKVCRLLNKVVVPYQMFLYKLLYKRAVKKWPHLKKEITVCADHGELLKEIV